MPGSVSHGLVLAATPPFLVKHVWLDQLFATLWCSSLLRYDDFHSEKVNLKY
jgi:hypothetical protein